MKQILFNFVFCVLSLFVTNTSFAQATAGQHDPYRNLGVWKIYNNNWEYPGTVPPEYSWSNTDDWYGTQSMPTAREKAEWALDDINAYRAEIGMKPLTKNVLKQVEGDIVVAILGCIALTICVIMVIVSFLDLIKGKQEIKRIKGEINENKKSMKENEQRFIECWHELTEPRRRNNIGNFVQMFGREPTEGEIVTGNVE